MVKHLNVYIQLMRPRQYLKNGFVWLPIIFGYHLTSVHAIVATTLAFVSFSLTASTVYIINDLADVHEDRAHPQKKHRPLASCAVKSGEAAWLALLLFCTALVISFIGLPTSFLFVIIAYVLLNIAYSQRFKRIPLVDIFCIAMGFVLRVLAGCVAIRIEASPWISMMAFLLALFLALAKRRDDKMLANQGRQVRKAIDGYNLEFISLAMGIMASVIIVAYLLYTVSPEIVAKHDTKYLYTTAIWVLIGLLRFLQVTYVDELTGSPTHVLIKDRILQSVIAIWLAHVYILLYL